MNYRTLTQLDSLAPRFKIPAERIQVLTTPDSFYSELKDHIRKAKKRIFLATLYIGTSQQELANVIDESLKHNSELDVHILTDGLRGTRESPGLCTASLIAPLAAKYPSRVHIAQYQTPKLRGLPKLLLPKRLNEGWGLQHMKLYAIDDQIILSGANLSTDYFTNRQDRYIWIKDKSVTDYFFSVFQAIAGLSHKLIPASNEAGFKLEWPNNTPDPKTDPKGFHKEARKRLLPLLKPSAVNDGIEQIKDQSSALIYPICQFTQLIGNSGSTEKPVMKTLAEGLADGYDWALTAGYFNVTEQLQNLLLKSKPEDSFIITAGEKANGFFQSKGLSGNVPALYSYLARRFLTQAERQGVPIKMLEWQKGVVNQPEGWSYHAKGLWVSKKGARNPFLTVIGSSNFTRRAYTHDLEAGAVIVTENKQLQENFGRELENLKQYTTPVSSKDYPRPTLTQKLFVKVFGDKL